MTAKPTLHIVAAVLVNGQGQLLLARRPSGKDLPDQWEFPGGKLEAGESEAEALVRELREELSLSLTPSDLQPLPFAIDHEFPKFFVHIPLFEARVESAAVWGAEGQEICWLPVENFAAMDILPGIRGILPDLQARYAAVLTLESLFA